MEKRYFLYDDSGNPSDRSYAAEEVRQKNLPADSYVCPENGSPVRISEVTELNTWKPPKIKPEKKEDQNEGNSGNGSVGWGFILFVISLVVLAVTNPKQSDFQSEMKNKYGFINFNSNKEYKNLILFSVYKVNNTSMNGFAVDRTYLGILGQVVELER